MYGLQDEFFDHMWDHTTDKFLNSFNNPKKLSDKNKRQLKEIICILCNNKNDEVACNKIYKILKKQEKDSIILIILQIIGSTRNKILVDLKSMLKKDNAVIIPNNPKSLSKDHIVLYHTEKYLTNHLRNIFADIIEMDCKITDEQLFLIFDILNKATWSGWIRQERAKRSSHYAEYRLAATLDKLDIPFEPQEKLDNPVSPDIQIGGISYDLVIPNKKTPVICFKCTVHTANIGQYGKSKDLLEIKEAKQQILQSNMNPKPVLFSLIDGIGMKLNVAGLKEILQNTDEFCQFKTMWKAIVVFANTCDRIVELWLPDQDNHAEFLSKYQDNITLQDRKPENFHNVGEAWLHLI